MKILILLFFLYNPLYGSCLIDGLPSQEKKYFGEIVKLIHDNYESPSLIFKNLVNIQNPNNKIEFNRTFLEKCNMDQRTDLQCLLQLSAQIIRALILKIDLERIKDCFEGEFDKNLLSNLMDEHKQFVNSILIGLNAKSEINIDENLNKEILQLRKEILCPIIDTMLLEQIFYTYPSSSQMERDLKRIRLLKSVRCL